jgi:hypothetical protein
MEKRKKNFSSCFKIGFCLSICGGTKEEDEEREKKRRAMIQLLWVLITSEA